MTKRHFEWAAAYVRRHRAAIELPGNVPSVLEEAFVALFRAFGPNFDEPRFRAACQVKS
jgi:hypothetical protein